jgi:hypothetical protein
MERGHQYCVLCAFFAKSHGHSCSPLHPNVSLIRISEYEEDPHIKIPDLCVQLLQTFWSISVEYGQFLCSSHLKPLPDGQKQYSKVVLPVLQHDLNWLAWAAPSKRKLPSVCTSKKS